LIVGSVFDEGVPVITLEVAGREWQSVVDTGFNGDLELPAELLPLLHHEYLGRTFSTLAGGQQIEEDAYLVYISFDGEIVPTEVTFAPGEQILVGTNLLQSHRLQVDLPARTVTLQRS